MNYVKIVRPFAFVRCGYLLTIEDALKDVPLNAIRKLVDEAAPSIYELHYKERAIDKIAKEIAYCKLKNEGFGDSRRFIVEEYRPELAGKVSQVISKKYHKSGFRQNGCEDEPPSLLRQKTHIILSCCCGFGDFWIDKLNTVEISQQEYCNTLLNEQKMNQPLPPVEIKKLAVWFDGKQAITVTY